MKIKDLIKKLSKYDGDLEVVVNGYECGFETLEKENVYKIKILSNVHKRTWRGEHVCSDKSSRSEFPDAKEQKVLCIGRY